MTRTFIVTAVGGLALALSACGGTEEAEVDVAERGVDVTDDNITAEEGVVAEEGTLQNPEVQADQIEQ